MISTLISLPIALGLLIFITLFLVIGFSSYAFTRWLIVKNLVPENKEIASQLLRLSGALLALLLSLTFADVRSELIKLSDSIDLEAAQIVDMYSDLEMYGTTDANLIMDKLKEYTKSIIENEWDKLSQNSFDMSTFHLAEEIQEDILNLNPASKKGELLRANLMDDLDEISDYRQMRQYASKTDPPIFFYISLFGFVITIGLFSVYQPNRNSLLLLGFYCAFIGVVVYFILTLSHPFVGTMKIQPETLITIYETFLEK